MGSYGGSASYGSSFTHPQMFDPFHAMPFNIAGALRNQFTNPLTQGFGYNGGTGPTAGFINQATPLLSSFLPGQSNLSQQITQGANSAYGGYQSAVDNFMAQLPGFNNSAGAGTAGAQTGLDYAKTAAADAFNPLSSRATYQEAAQRALSAARPGEAARGMLESGQGQAGEQSLLGTLAFNTMNQDFANRQQATQGVTNAAGGVSNATALQAQIAGMGPQQRAALFSAYPQLATLLTGASQLPMQGMNSVLQFLQGAQNPSYELLKMVLPQMGSETRSLNLAGSVQA